MPLCVRYDLVEPASRDVHSSTNLIAHWIPQQQFLLPAIEGSILGPIEDLLISGAQIQLVCCLPCRKRLPVLLLKYSLNCTLHLEEVNEFEGLLVKHILDVPLHLPTHLCNLQAVTKSRVSAA